MKFSHWILLAMSLLGLLLVSCTAASVSELDRSYHSLNRTIRRAPKDESPCKIVRRRVQVSFEGCESNSTGVKVCQGYCNTTNHFTYKDGKFDKEMQCACCQPSSSVVKVRRMMFNCNNVMTEKRVFISIPTECNNCVLCPNLS